MSDPHYLYIIQATDVNLLKIGITRSTQQRMKTLQTASPFKLRLVKTFEFASINDARRLECRVHSTLKRLVRHMGGEWFDISAKQAARFIAGIKHNTANEPKPAFVGKPLEISGVDRILRSREVEALTGLPSYDITREVAAGRFPKPFKLSAGTIGWRSRTIEAWVAQRRMPKKQDAAA